MVADEIGVEAGSGVGDAHRCGVDADADYHAVETLDIAEVRDEGVGVGGEEGVGVVGADEGTVGTTPSGEAVTSGGGGGSGYVMAVGHLDSTVGGGGASSRVGG